MSDRTFVTREQWPPSSSTADRRRPRVRFPGDSRRQHARISPEAPSNSRDVQCSPSWSASKATDNSLHPKSRPHRTRVRAEDLWDRDEEELLQQRNAKGLASSDPYGGVVDDLLHSDLVCGQADSPPESDTLNYAEEHISTRSAKSQSQINPKRPRDRYFDDFNTEYDAQPEPQKRKLNSTGYTAPSTMDNDLSHNIPQNALIDALLKELADEQGKNRAIKQELKRLQDHDKDREPKEQKGKENDVRTKGKQDIAAPSYQTTLTVDSSPMKKGNNRINCSAAFPKFESLPDNVQDIIFGMLLKNPDPIKLNTRRLVDFVKRDVGIPYSSSSTRKQKRRINVLEPPNNLQLELANMKAFLIQIPLHRWPSASVVKGLTLSLLFVSKAVHKKAAKCFYGNNVFEFSDARNSWMHLESFLNTIGPRNVSNMQQLSVAMPNWFHDLASDRVAFALLNAFSRKTRLAAGNNFTEAPLPSAISSCTSILAGHSGLKSFQIDVSLRDIPSFVDSNLLNPKEQFSAEEKILIATRRDDSIQLLGALINALRPGCNTKLIVHADRESKKGRKKFNRFLPQIQLEAEKFGLEVDRALDMSGKLRAFGNV